MSTRFHNLIHHWLNTGPKTVLNVVAMVAPQSQKPLYFRAIETILLLQVGVFCLDKFLKL
jgi:hypothetical protein